MKEPMILHDFVKRALLEIDIGCADAGKSVPGTVEIEVPIVIIKNEKGGVLRVADPDDKSLITAKITVL